MHCTLSGSPCCPSLASSGCPPALCTGCKKSHRELISAGNAVCRHTCHMVDTHPQAGHSDPGPRDCSGSNEIFSIYSIAHATALTKRAEHLNDFKGWSASNQTALLSLILTKVPTVCTFLRNQVLHSYCQAPTHLSTQSQLNSTWFISEMSEEIVPIFGLPTHPPPSPNFFFKQKFLKSKHIRLTGWGLLDTSKWK